MQSRGTKYGRPPKRCKECNRVETALWGDWQLYALISLKRMHALHGEFEQGAHLRRLAVKSNKTGSRPDG